MIYFECDYQEGAHPRIMEHMLETNMMQTIGYGEDAYTAQTKELLKAKLAAPQSDVHFLVGGTQTNTTFISSVLRPHQGVVSAHTGHIAVHETGAIEAIGHKVLTLPSDDGKLTAAQVLETHRAHWADASFEHMVQPGMVYISLPTENGTMYTKQELSELYAVCQSCDLPLYIDGARLGYGMASPLNDLNWEDVPRLCDAFYIGGTKQGALFGEALVINNASLQKDFRYLIKQKGGLLAKGRLLALQFLTLFTDDLYMQLSHHAIDMAMKLKDALIEMNVPLHYDSYTNQQFPILHNDAAALLREKFVFLDWERLDSHYSVVRFCTSWATPENHIDELIQALKQVHESCPKYGTTNN